MRGARSFVEWQELQVVEAIRAREKDYHEIAVDWLVSINTIGRVARRHGIKRKPVRQYNGQRPAIRGPYKLKRDHTVHDAAIAATLGSKPDAAVAADWGVSRQTVARVRKRVGLPGLGRGYWKRTEHNVTQRDWHSANTR